MPIAGLGAAVIAALAGAGGLHVETLPSGATVLIETCGDCETFAIEMLGSAGSLEDGDDQVGLTALLSSLLLRESAGLPDTTPAHEVERTGSTVSPVAGRLGIGLRATGPSHAFEDVFRILAGALIRPGLSPADLESEKALHRQTLMTSLDDPSEALERSARRSIFGDHELGRVGDPETYLRGITIEDLRAAHAVRFAGRRLIVVIAGAVDRDLAAGLAHAFFGDLAEGTPTPLPADGPARLERERRVRVKGRRAQPSLLVGWPLGPVAVEDEPALDLLAGLLTGPSGRLARELREERGWAYWVREEHWHYPDGGLFALLTAVPRKRLDDAERIIRETLESIARDGPSADEIETARRHHGTWWTRAWQRSAFRAATIASDTLRRREPLDLESRTARTQAVTAGSVRDLAARILARSEAAVLTLY